MVCRLQSRAPSVHVACLFNVRAGTVGRRGLIGRARRWRFRWNDEPAASAAAHLAAFAACRARFVRRPLVGGSLLVCGPTALARDLPLFFRGHRREPSPFFAFSSTHRSPSVLFSSRGHTTYGPFLSGSGGGSST